MKYFVINIALCYAMLMTLHSTYYDEKKESHFYEKISY